MPFDPALPANGSPLVSAEMRGQFNGLKNLIDAIQTIGSATVDGVSTLPPGNSAAVNVSASGGMLHFTFGIPQGIEGPQGIAGPPFASAVVDSVTTLPPGTSAAVSVSYDGSNVHFTFAIPHGQDGPQGIQGYQGLPGEVTLSQLDNAITGVLNVSSNNSSGVNTLNQPADANYNQAQMQDVLSKLDELILALRR
jgi:hypothetical protein|uniref:hypothetical protein n=1 Tax=Prosthecobacter sp. TaxID=1965333 RepID=UPI003784C669